MTRRTRSAFVCAAIAALAVTAVAACGSSSKGGGGGTPKSGGTLTIQAGDSGNPTLVEDFNPFQASTTGLHGTFLLYEPLEFRSPIDGSFTPFVATGHKFTDPKTLVFTIRQGVKWSDGTDLTSADVLFTFNLLKKFPALDTNGIWAQVASVAASGNDFTVTFKAPNVPFAGVVAKTLIVPEHVWSSIPDRTTIAAKAVNGYLDAASQAGMILPNLKKWLDPSLPDQGIVKQDPTAAQAAFTQAGYTSQGGKLVGKNGKQATMSIVMPNNFSDWVAAAKEVANQLGKVGIKVSLDLPQYAQYSSSTQAGTFDAAMGGFGGTGDPYTDFNNALNSSFAAPVNKPTANNFERFKDPSVDQALGTLAAATDPGAQSQATYTLEHVMYDKVPVVLMYYGGSWGLFSTKNFTGWPSADNPYTLPTSYDNSLLLVVTHLTK